MMLQLCSERWRALTFWLRINFRVIWWSTVTSLPECALFHHKGSPRLHKTHIPLNDQRCKPWPRWPDSCLCRLMPFFLHWTAVTCRWNGNTTQYKMQCMSHKTDYKELNFWYFLKTTTVDDNILPALYRTGFVPTSAINWHLSRGSEFRIVNLPQSVKADLWSYPYSVENMGQMRAD
jgi:hypothetical protein